ncbi:MAG: Copper transport outer membrane protein MctB, partial [Solirubrobacteraceae bacterium]|nr:Copper transport outer membrane protein MctB [Solirubrobacteraceae bacterium]
VDNVDEQAGRAAMVFVLAGAQGAYGRRDSAQALLPPVVGQVR